MTAAAAASARSPGRDGSRQSESAETATELVDTSSWPGTTDAAKLVGRHPSTIKLWRSQGRIHAVLDASGCWRYNPDSLAEAAVEPEVTDPGAVLAQGMNAIVTQGSAASDRLLEMTTLATDGLKETIVLLRKELERAYGRIADLEKERTELLDKTTATHVEDLKHDRALRRMEHKHELDLVGVKESSTRLGGLVTILGPIAASITSRLLGDLGTAERLEASAAGAPVAAAPNPSPARSTPPAAAEISSTAVSTPATPSAPLDDSVPFQTRLTDAMARLCATIRSLDEASLERLRALLPGPVAVALDAVVKNASDSEVGVALAAIIRAAQNLSDLQFKVISPLAPATLVGVLSELRELLRREPVDE